ncbi:MAG: hypothetical protein HN337_00855 [Deltaproteobacteria bacterium]|nr:hypothetical protein [Deltaproteobacteria bacterium]
MVTQVKKMDTNSDGRISKEEYKQYWKGADSKWNSRASQSSAYKGTYSPKKGASFSDFGDAQSPSAKSLENVESQMKSILTQMDQAKGEQAKLETLENQYNNLLEQSNQLQKMVAKSTNAAAGTAKQMKTKGNGVHSLKANMMSGGSKPQGLNAASAKSQTYGMGVAKASSFAPPQQWGEVEFGGMNGLDASAMLQSSMVKEEYVQKAWDGVNKNSQKGKQLMMLFFYYARMAESGDMGAVYQFMKFITYIISKDKAKQQIEMGKKLIQLQELSRKWTNKLIDVQSNATDSSASSELMKTMTIVKSETDAIATSQKLISQMMEEFAQVVETLTNTTKGALETQGRILRTVSTFR